ncbi:hypothetical protein BKA63DRAFT_579073, partial [Paraphoma chrysanthemicola]
MDLRSLDHASARLIVQLRLEEITDALQNTELEGDQSASFRALRKILQDQLEDYGGAVRVPLRPTNDSSSDQNDDDAMSATDDSAESDESENEDSESKTEDIFAERESENEPQPEPQPEIVCCACSEPYPKRNTIELDCKPDLHSYCHQCVEELFNVSVHKDSALFPPRCCQTRIPFALCRSFIPNNLMQEIEAKQQDYENKNATFCSETTCSKLIPADCIEAGVGMCTACNHRTCTVCKGVAHEGVCPQDEQTKLLVATAGMVMWQTCAQCRNMVELDVGCFHIV